MLLPPQNGTHSGTLIEMLLMASTIALTTDAMIFRRLFKALTPRLQKPSSSEIMPLTSPLNI